jgi:cysteinyl-tRNA synthetase
VDDEKSELDLDGLKQMGYTGREIRYWLISNHYRKPLNFSLKKLDLCARALKRLDACVYALQKVENGSPYPELDQLLYDIKHGFINAMDDDLNISAAMASVYRRVKQINTLLKDNKIDPEGAEKILEAFKNIDSVLNIFTFEKFLEDSHIQDLIKKRDNARKEKNFRLADEIREILVAKGVTIQDERI